MKSGMTMLELAIVLVIIAIIIGAFLPNYFSMQENAVDKEAFASLKLIQSAERIYNLEMKYYYPSSGTSSSLSNINTYLKLDLKSDSGRNWNYTVDSCGCGLSTRTTANGGNGTKTYHLGISDNPNTDADWGSGQTGACGACP